MTTQVKDPELATAARPAITAPPEPAAETAAVPEKRKFTVAEYYRMAEVGILRPEERVELIEGEVLVMAPPGPLHAGDVIRSIEVFSWRRDERFIVQVQNPLRLDSGCEPEPDLMLLRRREDYYTTTHPTPADTLLVMEVFSTRVGISQNKGKSPRSRRGFLLILWHCFGSDKAVFSNANTC